MRQAEHLAPLSERREETVAPGARFQTLPQNADRRLAGRSLVFKKCLSPVIDARWIRLEEDIVRREGVKRRPQPGQEIAHQRPAVESLPIASIKGSLRFAVDRPGAMGDDRGSGEAAFEQRNQARFHADAEMRNVFLNFRNKGGK